MSYVSLKHPEPTAVSPAKAQPTPGTHMLARLAWRRAASSRVELRTLTGYSNSGEIYMDHP